MSLEMKKPKDIFLVAIENHTPDKWQAYLDGACGDDAQLRERVEVLLEAHQGEDAFLDRSAIADQPITERSGTTIGKYKLMEQIGEGGMGVVFVAEQTEPLRRKVALKIIKPGMDTKEVIARFEAERQVLALMDHPNIARVLDAGATESGRPYIVMELVRGIPITEYCDRKRLSTRARLELFVAVCQAIHHAHQKSVIHRDVKPSNVLITEHDGTPLPKVIDFGVAKATNHRLTERTIYTRHQQMVGTPLYMSPEQAELSALDVDTRTDIYSLGVLLYELLTGATPIERQRFYEAAYDEIRRIIREEDPPKPSTRISALGESTNSVCQHRQTDARKLGHILRKELDWIVMKALEKDRTRRYETALGFSMDIHRFLNEETVQACPPSMVYHMRKFVRRHRGAVATGISLLLLLCAGVVGTTTGWIDAVNARRKMEDRGREAIVARNEAVAAEGSAKKSLALADRERDRAVRSAAELRKQTYVGDIGLAYEAIRKGDLGRAQNLLGHHRPGPDEEDLRGFEWRYLWSRSQGNYTADLGPYHGFLSGVAISPDGQFVVLNRTDPRRLDVIHLASGTTATSIETQHGVDPLIFSLSGDLLVGRGRDQGNIVGWDTSTWEARVPLPLNFPLTFGHRTEEEIFVARDGDHFSVYSATNWQKIADLVNAPGAGPLLEPGFGHEGFMNTCLAVSADDRFVYLAGAKGIRRWDMEQRTELAPFTIGTNQRTPTEWGEGLSCLATSGAGQMAAADRWGRVHLINPETGQVLHTFKSHIGWVTSIEFAEDGTRLVSAGADRTVVVYDPTKKSVVDRLLGHQTNIYGLDISADGRIVVSGSGNGGHVLSWSLSETASRVLECAGIKGLAVMDDSRIAVFRDSAKDFEFYDPFKDTLEPAGTERFLQVLQESDAILVSASPNAKWTLTLEGNTLVVWNDIAAQRVQILSHKSGNITQAVFSPDSRFLVTAETGSETRLWRTDNWSSQVLCQPVPRTWGIGFSGDSRRVAISEHEGPIRVFDLTQGPLQNLEVTVGNTAYSVALSSSGSYLATGHQDDLIRIWSVATGETIARLEGHIQGPSSLSFSPDDRTLASSNFATVKLWNVATWRELMSVEADVQRVQFSPDGRYLTALVTRAESDAFRGEGVGLRILKTPTLEEIDANSTMH